MPSNLTPEWKKYSYPFHKLSPMPRHSFPCYHLLQSIGWIDSSKFPIEEVGMKQALMCVLAVMLLLVSNAYAQQYVYPAKGQTPEQQKSDEAACYTWAVQQTGFDPATPQAQQQAAKPPTTATGTKPGAGVRGAAKGAVVGEVVGDDAQAGSRGGGGCRAQSKPQANRGRFPAGHSAAASCGAGKTGCL